MPSNHTSKTEDLRLRALQRGELLDTKAEAAFDALTRTAAIICGTPISLVSLVDADRQWFKSAYGLTQGDQTAREHAFCAHAIEEPSGPLEVPDARSDPRFAENPLVTGAPDIRFYAGIPVKSGDGYPLGTLCVIDRVPRSLSADQWNALKALATAVEELIAYREVNNRTAQQLSQIYTETPGLLYLLDSTGVIIEVSELMLSHFGYRRHDVVGRNARELMSVDARKAFLRVRDQLWAQGGCRDLPSQFVNASGQVHDVLICATIESDADGIPVRVKCVLTDVTEQLKMQRALEVSARTDGLTGVSNRDWFRERVAAELDRVRRHHRTMALIVFDVDYFKQLNDEYGHATGDEVLRQLAMRAGNGLRINDVVGRLGGEEFAILLPETDLPGALRCAERLRDNIESLDWNQYGIRRKTTISAGVSVNCTDLSLDEMIRRADVAMYRAKHAGRNRVIAWSDEMESEGALICDPASAKSDALGSIHAA